MLANDGKDDYRIRRRFVRRDNGGKRSTEMPAACSGTVPIARAGIPTPLNQLHLHSAASQRENVVAQNMTSIRLETDADTLLLLRASASSLDLDPSAINSINTQIQLLDTEAQSRAKEVAEIQSVLQRLQQEYNHTVTDLRRKKSLLSPIRQLPSDILLHIFGLATDDGEHCLSSPPFIFRSSSAKRNTIGSTPRIPIRTALALSGGCPLNISIEGSSATKEAWEFIAECVAPTSNRWKSFHLSVQDAEIIVSLSKISGCLPLLESLDFTFYNLRPIKHFDEALSSIFCSVPLLHTIRISGNVFSELSLPLHQLTNLDLDLMCCRNSGRYSFYDCIAQGTKLESFTFLDTYSDMLPLPEITRPNIGQLSLGYTIPSSLKYCAFTEMEQLTLFPYSEEWALAPIVTTDQLTVLSEFLKRSANRLRSFTAYKPIPFPAFNDIAIETFTSLMDLATAINKETLTETIQRLADPSFIPCLRHLSLHTRLPVISLFRDDSLRSMAVSRHNVGLQSLAVSVLSLTSLRTLEPPANFHWSGHLLRMYKLKATGLDVKFLLSGRDYFVDQGAVDELTTWLKTWSML
ncbi:hypothetical protein ARMSODRAFT_981545 [Armillaria solidipes]|uniref:F-box domain-containing protein n=1 Tax=Armillaria solidipes TaxID=1076256 RepID=A0A2H3BC29_9AGAR|nr:hypothetical protein ARMSODRAFT_981545 [Armillaria solidipes]